MAAVDYDLLARINELRLRASRPTSDEDDELQQVEARAEQLYACSQVFVVYGSLGPGGPNHHRVQHLGGSWLDGFCVNGELRQEGWGAALGFPGLQWNRTGPQVKVDVLSSSKLPAYWPILDEFEGEGYYRALVPVTNGREFLVGNIYLLVTPQAVQPVLHRQAQA